MTCPRCGAALAADAQTCRLCLLILDDGVRRERNAGRLGADGRGSGRELEDPPLGPIPITGSGLAGGTHGVATAAFRLIATGLLLNRRKRRQRDA